ncbi:MAG: cation transporter [Smithella sp.]
MKTIKIKGMSCQHCVMAVTKALNAIDGIENVKVDLKTETASYDETRPVDMAVVTEAIKKAGYDVAG